MLSNILLLLAALVNQAPQTTKELWHRFLMDHYYVFVLVRAACNASFSEQRSLYIESSKGHLVVFFTKPLLKWHYCRSRGNKLKGMCFPFFRGQTVQSHKNKNDKLKQKWNKNARLAANFKINIMSSHIFNFSDEETWWFCYNLLAFFFFFFLAPMVFKKAE